MENNGYIEQYNWSWEWVALEDIPIYEHPVLYKARLTRNRNKAVIKRLYRILHKWQIHDKQHS